MMSNVQAIQVKILKKFNFLQTESKFKGVCVILFVPPISDSLAEERNEYLLTLKKVFAINYFRTFKYIYTL